MKLKTCFAILSSTVVLGGGLMFLNQKQEHNDQKQVANLTTVQVFENLELFQKSNKENEEEIVEAMDTVVDNEVTHEDSLAFESEKVSDELDTSEKKQEEPIQRIVRDETIAFTKETISDHSMLQGEKIVDQVGQNGHIQHVEIQGKITESIVLKEMKPEIIRVGTQKKIAGSMDEGKANEMYHRVNAIRKEAGLQPYKWSTKLEKVSEVRATEIQEKFSHTRPNGKSWDTIDPNVYGENLARKAYSVDVALNALMASPEHKANILGPFNEIAIALFVHEDGSWNWVQLFGYS